ncbi:hypothetical protein F5Y08DRAFT_340510 [Xylaria arbuscula]|nr:hypothetical protein F5Y08DRAFT_340510 [Xylaria arbuscula]
MEKSLKMYLGPQKATALEGYLDDLISRPVAQCPVVGYGIWPCDETYRYATVEATNDDGSLWTHIVLSVRGILSKDMAEHILADVDNEIYSKLSPEQQPPRLSYALDDDSSTLYRAKSRRIRGTLPESWEGLKVRASEEDSHPTDTPPASPRGDFVTKSVFVEVELASKGLAPLVW